MSNDEKFNLFTGSLIVPHCLFSVFLPAENAIYAHSSKSLGHLWS